MMAVRCESSRVVVRSSLRSLHAVDDDTAMVAHLGVGDTDRMKTDVDELQKELVYPDGLLFSADEAEWVVAGRVACSTEEGLLYSS